MYKINRKTRYEIIKELIKEANPETLNKLVNDLWDNDSIDNTEERREELLEYLEDMNTLWHEKNIDLTDRQYIRIETKEECEERLKKQFETFIKNKEKQSLKEKSLSDYYWDEEELLVSTDITRRNIENLKVPSVDGTFIPGVCKKNKETIYQKIKNRFTKN